MSKLLLLQVQVKVLVLRLQNVWLKMVLKSEYWTTMLKLQKKRLLNCQQIKHFAVVADVSKQAEVAAAFQKVVDHFGDLNVVVNNAVVAPTTVLLIQLLKNSSNVHLISMSVVLFGCSSCTSTI